ncbi:nucleotidyltransferase family protein [Ornithinimicrobium faecis]|uniref:Nucleotidyltransferase family protein n=1 Tax=Ornithinimicrobium faecis TaxID=2934158 RepID=A0ABY4YWS6_9MICO|nr:nucleotidyltransferase family protein [Ornithinimicrobium sp. HY1793]USQ81218.1 nucleotidyltransferase family protein [Ornithinimicrobium sp. HY1793]
MTSHPTRPRSTGLLLAAGAGRRYGQPKGTVEDAGGPWVVRAARALLDGGCGDVLVVTGAQAEDVEALLANAQLDNVTTTRCGTWEQGMGESLRSGLTALATRGRTIPQQALVHLVDLPDVGADVVARVLDASGAGTGGLVRAAYGGRPGHPVLLGADHWEGVLGRARGDAGARGYLRRVPPLVVECGDLASGVDVDGPPS